MGQHAVSSQTWSDALSWQWIEYHEDIVEQVWHTQQGVFRCKRPPDVRDDPKRPVKASPRTYFLMRDRDLWRFLAAGSQPHSPWDRDVACVLGPSVRPTAVRQGTDVLHVPKQTHFGQDTVSDENVSHTCGGRVGIFGMPPWTEGRAQARSLLAPYAWHGSQRNRELPMVDPLTLETPIWTCRLSHFYPDDEFVVPVGCQPWNLLEDAQGPAFDVRSLIWKFIWWLVR